MICLGGISPSIVSLDLSSKSGRTIEFDAKLRNSDPFMEESTGRSVYGLCLRCGAKGELWRGRLRKRGVKEHLGLSVACFNIKQFGGYTRTIP